MLEEMRMKNDSGTALATISETGAVPKTRATDPSMVQQAVQNLILKDSKRSFKRSRVNGLIDGNPPFPQSKLTEIGRKDATNANWGTARAYMESGSGAIYDLFSESPGHFNARTSFGVPEQQEEWSRGMSALADVILKKSKVWDFNNQLSIWDMTLHGCGPFMFEDEFQVLPKAFLCDDLKVPEFTKSDTEYWDQSAVIASYYPPQLYAFIRDEKAATDRGWDVEYTKKIISNAMDIHTSQQNTNTWVWCQQELKNNAMAYYDDTKVCRVAHVFWKEFDERVTHVIVPTVAGVGTKTDFLFKSVGRYASFNECIHPMYWDHGNGGFHHSVTGLGVKMYKAMWEQNNMICNLVDKAKAPKILFKPTTAESSQKFSLVTFGDYGVLPANFDWQQTGVAGLLNDGLAMNREIGDLLQSNLSTYRQPMMKEEGNPITASQVNWQASQQSSLSKTQYNRYYKQLDMLFAEIFRRLCLPGTTDKLAQEFQKKCKEAGIPQKAYSEIESVTAVRVVGQGSAFMRQQSLGKLWVNVGPDLPEDGRSNLKDDIIAAEAGQSAVKRYNPKRTRSTLPGDQEAEAVQWIGIAKTGVPPTVTSSQNPVIYAGVWLQAATEALQSVSQGANPIEVVSFLETIGPSIDAQLSRFANSPTREQVHKKMSQQFAEIAQATDELKKQIEQAQQAQQEQAQQTQQVMSDEQLKELEMTSNIRRKDIVTGAQLQQKDQKMRQKLQEDREKQAQQLQEGAQRMALADADTAAGIERENLKAQAQAKSSKGE